MAPGAGLLREYPEHTTTDAEIARRIWLYLDIDPNRPSGVPASESEREAAKALAEALRERLRGLGWPEPAWAFSGNGYARLYRIDLPNDPASTALIKNVLAACADWAAEQSEDLSNLAKVDRTTFNAARIIRLFGTTNRKGGQHGDRVHRISGIIPPDEPQEIVPPQKLEEVAALAQTPANRADPTTIPRPSTPSTAFGGQGGGSRHLRLDVPRWLGDRGCEHSVGRTSDGRDLYRLNRCPFNDQHGARGETVVMQADNGRMSAKCQHDSCSGEGWQEFKQAIGQPEPHHFGRAEGGDQQSASPRNCEARRLAPGTCVRPSDRDNVGTVVSDDGQTVTVHFVSRNGQEATKPFSRDQLRLPDGRPLDSPPPRFRLIPSREFADTAYEQRYLVKGILVADQPAICGGRPKTFKTSILTDLAVSLGSGTQFLGRFECEQARVAYLSGESGAFTMQETAKRICVARRIDLRELEVLWEFKLPRIADDQHLEALGEEVQRNDVDVLILDPAYLCLLGGDTRGRQANNIFDMGPLLLRLSELGERTNSTVILCHHFRKPAGPDRFNVPELDELSMAGFAEWARQWLLLGKRRECPKGEGHHELWLNVGGSAGHSGCWGVDIDEGKLGDDFAGRRWRVSIRDEDEIAAAKAHAKQANQATGLSKLALKLRSSLSEVGPSGATAHKLCEMAGMNSASFRRAINVLLENGEAEACTVIQANRKYEGFRLVQK